MHLFGSGAIKLINNPKNGIKDYKLQQNFSSVVKLIVEVR
jgi:hypothetical protein